VNDNSVFGKVIKTGNLEFVFKPLEAFLKKFIQQSRSHNSWFSAQ